MNKQLTAEELRNTLRYDIDTGDFFWINSPKNCSGRIRPGDRAGYLQSPKKGHWKIRINGKSYFNHRLVWLYVTGEWPKDQIDHINRNGSDNRFSNLREATNGQNRANTRSARILPKGVGIKVHKHCISYTADITYGKKHVYLGSFPTVEEAAYAYRSIAMRVHGDFYNL